MASAISRILGAVRTSTAWRIPPVLPCGPPPLFAARITWIASAASDSIAAATSSGDTVAAPLAPIRRRRDSARAGRAETASNAAARRWPPWPTPPRAAFAGAAFGWLRSGLAAFGLATLGLPLLADARVRPPGDPEPLSLAACVMGIDTHTLDRQRGAPDLAIGHRFPPR